MDKVLPSKIFILISSKDAFFCGRFGELNLISVKIIILNYFCNLEQVLSLI